MEQSDEHKAVCFSGSPTPIYTVNLLTRVMILHNFFRARPIQELALDRLHTSSPGFSLCNVVLTFCVCGEGPKGMSATKKIYSGRQGRRY